LAIWIAALPMPLPPACTSAVSPGRTRALVISMRQAVIIASPTAAASVALTPSGMGTRLDAGATTYSANAPWLASPRISPRMHIVSSPAMQNSH
jgi:hypothetical protein